MLVSSFSSHVWVAVELVTWSSVRKSEYYGVQKVLQWVLKRLKGNFTGKLEGKEKKASPTVLETFLVQDLFLTVTSCKTSAESNTNLACMWFFQVSLNCFMWVKQNFKWDFKHFKIISLSNSSRDSSYIFCSHIGANYFFQNLDHSVLLFLFKACRSFILSMPKHIFVAITVLSCHSNLTA